MFRLICSTRVKTLSVSITVQWLKAFLMRIEVGKLFSWFQCKTLHSRHIAFFLFPAKHKSITYGANCSLGKQVLINCSQAKPSGWCSGLPKLALTAIASCSQADSCVLHCRGLEEVMHRERGARGELSASQKFPFQENKTCASRCKNTPSY